MAPGEDVGSEGRISALLAMVLLGGVVASDATAAPSDLFQKPGAFGCITDVPNAAPAATSGVGSAAPFLAVSPDGKSLYVKGGALAIFDRDANGVVTQKAGTVGCITASDDGSGCRFDAVSLFDRAVGGGLVQQPGTGGLRVEQRPPLCVDGYAINSVTSATVSPDGKNVYLTATASMSGLVVFDRGQILTTLPPPPPVSPVPPTPPDTTKPLLSALKFSIARFSATARGPSVIARAPGCPTGSPSPPR